MGLARRDYRQWRGLAFGLATTSGVSLVILASLPSASDRDSRLWAIVGAFCLALAMLAKASSREPSGGRVWTASLLAMAAVGVLSGGSDHGAGFPIFLLIPVLSGAYLLSDRESIAMSGVALAVLFVALLVRPAGFDLLLLLQITLLTTCGAVATRGLRRGRDRLINDLQRLAATDGLTGLANRAAFEATADRLLLRARRNANPLAAVIFDIDHFKALNDAHGHAAGDSALRAFAETLGGHTRPMDLVARIGGEEFAVIMPGASGLEAGAFAERVGSALRANEIGAGRSRITVSAGVAALGPRDTAESLMRAADRALYAAKGAGRDRVVVSDVSDELAAL